jgi:hypothetical protein
MPELKVLGKQRKSLICFEIAANREICESKVSRCYCQPLSSLLVSLHAKQLCFGAAILRETSKVGNEAGDYAESREIPSLRIRSCSVERFIPRSAAAPFRPATTHLLCLRALRIC